MMALPNIRGQLRNWRRTKKEGKIVYTGELFYDPQCRDKTTVILDVTSEITGEREYILYVGTDTYRAYFSDKERGT